MKPIYKIRPFIGIITPFITSGPSSCGFCPPFFSGKDFSEKLEEEVQGEGSPKKNRGQKCRTQVAFVFLESEVVDAQKMIKLYNMCVIVMIFKKSKFGNLQKTI